MAIKLIVQHHPEEDTHPQLFVDDNDGDGVGQWVPRQKHLLLCKYITATRAPAKKFTSWVYIDPFCGPGRIQVRNENFTRPGGAVVAWMQSAECGHLFTHMFIGDKDPIRVAACETRLRALNAPVQAFHGPADETVKEMISKVPSGALCLVYIDPYNLALLSHQMIQTLTTLDNVDFVVHFSTMDLLRNVDMELNPDRARFDEVLPGWRQRLAKCSKSSLPSRFYEEWNEQVRRLGFAFSDAQPLITNDDHRGIYKLVCFSRHELALRIWKDIARDKTRDLFV